MGFSAFEMLRCCLCSFVFLRFFCDVLFCCMSFGFDRLFLRVYFEEETLSLCFVDLSSILLPRRRVFVRIFSVFLSLILAVSLVVISLYLCFFFFLKAQTLSALMMVRIGDYTFGHLCSEARYLLQGA